MGLQHPATCREKSRLVPTNPKSHTIKKPLPWIYSVGGFSFFKHPMFAKHRMFKFAYSQKTDANRKMIINQRFADYIAGLYKFFVCIYILASQKYIRADWKKNYICAKYMRIRTIKIIIYSLNMRRRQMLISIDKMIICINQLKI